MTETACWERSNDFVHRLVSSARSFGTKTLPTRTSQWICYRICGLTADQYSIGSALLCSWFSYVSIDVDDDDERCGERRRLNSRPVQSAVESTESVKTRSSWVDFTWVTLRSFQLDECASLVNDHTQWQPPPHSCQQYVAFSQPSVHAVRKVHVLNKADAQGPTAGINLCGPSCRLRLEL